MEVGGAGNPASCRTKRVALCLSMSYVPVAMTTTKELVETFEKVERARLDFLVKASRGDLFLMSEAVEALGAGAHTILRRHAKRLLMHLERRPGAALSRQKPYVLVADVL